ncbi:hypothetical protein Glove_196g60 [Diversispora epigaea]|uniref:TLDc domain-containing protein n=1 Tax=Diversispora epigaea TaxID=1348612 RepID=A0A397INY6_9GLOM|nr:hypothetical protein Glove_196g60 [Diversispora epigaea]
MNNFTQNIYIYDGIVDSENIETKFSLDLMIAANEFEIKELTKKLENDLIETAKILFFSTVKIWEYIIRWGISQNSTLPVDHKEWTKENFTTLKTTLQQCLLISNSIFPYSYLRSINGFIPQTFWDTVLILKVKRTEEIIGGCNSLIWASNHS